MLKQWGRSYVAHAVVGGVLAWPVALGCLELSFWLDEKTGIFGLLYLVGLALLFPTALGAFMYEVRRWLTREPFALRSLFIYGLTGSTSVVIVSLFFYALVLVEQWAGIRIGSTSWLQGDLTVPTVVALTGACVGMACLAIDNKR